MSRDKEETNTAKTRDLKKIIINSVGILLCVILLPILVLNCILIIDGIINPEKVPSIGDKTPMIVLTDSMYPTIKSGDLIICEKIDATEVKVDDVISFFDPTGKSSSVVTHRVNSIIVAPSGEIFFYTQGDNNNIEDITPVPAENLVGKWTGIRIWGLGHVVLFTQSPIGLIICVFLPIGGVVAIYLLRKRKQDGKKQDDIDALKKELEALKQERAETQPNEVTPLATPTSVTATEETPPTTEQPVDAQTDNTSAQPPEANGK